MAGHCSAPMAYGMPSRRTTPSLSSGPHEATTTGGEPMAVTATILANFNARLTGAAGGLGVADVRHPLDTSFNFADGTGLNQASQIWSRSAQSLAASTSETW